MRGTPSSSPGDWCRRIIAPSGAGANMDPEASAQPPGRRGGEGMGRERATRQAEACPFLVPVMADWLWLRPTSAYCRHPGGRVRVPAAATIDCICMTAAHLVCAGYLESLDRAAARAAGPAP